MSEVEYAKGLEGVVAAESTICLVDGIKGELFYRGYSVADLAAQSTFEETTYLLLYGKLPTSGELEDFSSRMRDSRYISPAVQAMIRSFPESGSLMELLQSVIAFLSGTVQHQIAHSATCNCRRTLHQIAQLPTVIATYQRFREGKDYLAPRADLSHGANFLYMLRGEAPDEDEARIFDACLVLHAEHGFNASTFTARVVASTISTCYCSVSAAIGALNGALHGGANERVLEMLDDIGTVDNVDRWIADAFRNKQKVMGMGHRVYRVKDPRAVIQEAYLRELSEKKGNTRLLDMLTRVEECFRTHMDDKGKAMYPNVDFYSGAVYELLGIPRDLFTPIFGMSRASGWLAHILEQRQGNRLYRPSCIYTGPEPTDYIAMSERG